MVNQDNVIQGYDGTGGLYGYWNESHLNALVETTYDRIRKEAEMSDYFDSFLHFFSATSGAGSTLHGRVSSMIQDEMPKVSNLCFNMW
eukprot:CAMPEP_0116871998 /NCGR_PEP_ID=MMETSP0463-20121206/2606_1 /TAXON_ID=181622 /ORGANISM="Strombidinopsis sp, Strain SopsisLIS2011" /LENGTH=87 /DNA_ID=CAMNT_0004511495 /DNA_START=167 /DNA_END=427 /DNA_ORIENTATION=-